MNDYPHNLDDLNAELDAGKAKALEALRAANWEIQELKEELKEMLLDRENYERLLIDMLALRRDEIVALNAKLRGFEKALKAALADPRAEEDEPLAEAAAERGWIVVGIA